MAISARITAVSLEIKVQVLATALLHSVSLILITLLHTLSIPPITTTVITPTLYLYHSSLKMNLFQKFLPTTDLALLIGLPSRTRDHGMVLGFFLLSF